MPLYNDFKPETRSLIRALVAAGFTIESVDNGEPDTDMGEPFPFEGHTLAEFIDEACACDECRLYVKNPSGKPLGLYLVFGNSPGELVCDYHCDPLLDTVTCAESEKWEGRKQPTREG